MLYQINDGVVAYGDNVILYDLQFEIRNKEKIAIVGRNGCGKTTLLKLISGELSLDIGDDNPNAAISKTGNPSIGYLKQIAFDNLDIPLEEEVRKCVAPMIVRKEKLDKLTQELQDNYSDELIKKYTDFEEKFREDGGYYFEKEYEVMIRKFGFSDEERNKPLRDFSGGQQTKIAFIKLLLSKPDILLLDEPTNHLDITTVEWLESYLKDYPKAVVLVSHDRMFIDNIADVVYEIEYGTAKRYPGNYSYFTNRKKEIYDKQLKDYEAQQKEIARLEKMVEKFISHPTKVSMAKSKQKSIERMDLIERPDRYNNKTFYANFKPICETGKDVLYVKNLEIGYDSILSTINLDLKSGEKLGILGSNGLGKSTFLKTLVDIIQPISGEYKYGTNVHIGYFDQQMALYTSNKTLIDDYWDDFSTLSETEVRKDLGAFLFTGDDVYKNVDMLSGGEKVRLALCKIFKTKPNVLILDEPTNHMDIVGKETLESMLKEFEGTIIFVSHDRYFVKQVATQILEFENGTTTLYRFGYEEYKEHLATKEESEKSTEFFGGFISNKGTIEKKESDGQAKKSYELGKEKSRLERKISKIEALVEDKEIILSKVLEDINYPIYQSDYIKLVELQNKKDSLEEEILSYMEEIEILQEELNEYL